MASVRAGVQTQIDVQSVAPTGPQMPSWSLSDGSTWTVIWFAAAIIILFFVL